MFIPALSPRFELDRLLLRSVQQLTPHLLVSSAETLSERFGPLEPKTKLWLDSGGYAALNPRTSVHREDGGLGTLKLPLGGELSPATVMRLADELGATVEFTLDFPTRNQGLKDEYAALGEANALWRLSQPRTRAVYAAVQPGQDLSRILALQPSGLALGGLVPHLHDPAFVQREIRRVRRQIGPDLPLHVFGFGKPEHIQLALRAGADSVDSASPQRSAVSGRDWASGRTIPGPSLPERLGIALKNISLGVEAGLDEITWSSHTTKLRCPTDSAYSAKSSRSSASRRSPSGPIDKSRANAGS